MAESLLLRIIGDASQLKNELDKASGHVNSFSEKIGAIGKVMTVAGGAITGAFALIIKKTIDAGDAFNDMSLRTGVSVENLSALAYAAKQSGTDIESIETSLKFLTRAMDDASKGTGTAKDTFIALGISVTDTEGELRPTVDVMKDVATAVAAIDDPAKQAAIAMELFGARSGTQLVPLLKLGETGIDALMKKAEELGIVMSTESAQAADEFKERIYDLKESLGAVGRDIANILIPPLLEFANKTTEIIKKVREWIDAHKPLVEMIIKVGAELGILAAAIGPILMAVNAFIKLKAAMIAISAFSETTFIPSLKNLQSGANSMAVEFSLITANVYLWMEVWRELNEVLHSHRVTAQDAVDAYAAQQFALIKLIEAYKLTNEEAAKAWENIQKGKNVLDGVRESTVGSILAFTDLSGALALVNKMAGESGITVESLIKNIEALSTGFELSQKYLSDNNKSMSDSIKYYSSMISLMSNLNSGLKIELEILITGTEEYKKKEEEIKKNAKALNEMKAALDAALAPLEGLDLITAKMALLGDSAVDNKTKLVYLGDEAIILKQKLDESLPNTGEWWEWNTALNANEQSVKDLSTVIENSKLASLDAQLGYINTKFGDAKPTVEHYRKELSILNSDLDILKTNLKEAEPDSTEYWNTKTAIEEMEKKIKELTKAMNDLIIGEKPIKDALKDMEDGFKEAGKEADTFGSIMNTQFAGMTEQINIATVSLSNFTKEGLAAAIVSTKMSFAPLINDVKEMMAATKEMFMAGQLGAVNYNSIMIFYTKQLNEILKEMNEKISIFKSGYAEYQSMVGGTSGGSKKITSYQEGTSYVPRTQLALVHQGEEINPPGQRSYDQRKKNYSTVININNPVIRDDNDIYKIRDMIENVLDNYGKQQLNRQGKEIWLGA